MVTFPAILQTYTKIVAKCVVIDKNKKKTPILFDFFVFFLRFQTQFSQSQRIYVILFRLTITIMKPKKKMK